MQLQMFSEHALHNAPDTKIFLHTESLEEEALAERDYFESAWNNDGDDGLLQVGDVFCAGGKNWELKGYLLDYILFEDDDMFCLETYYVFKDGKAEKIVESSELLDFVDEGSWEPVSPPSCVWAVNSLIWGTEEFNQQLHFDLQAS